MSGISSTSLSSLGTVAGALPATPVATVAGAAGSTSVQQREADVGPVPSPAQNTRLPGMAQPAPFKIHDLLGLIKYASDEELKFLTLQAGTETMRITGRLAQMYAILKASGNMLAAELKRKAAEELEERAELQLFSGMMQSGVDLGGSAASLVTAFNGGRKGVQEAVQEGKVATIRQEGNAWLEEQYKRKDVLTTEPRSEVTQKVDVDTDISKRSQSRTSRTGKTSSTESSAEYSASRQERTASRSDDSDASSGSETSGEASHASSASDRSQKARSSSSDGSESSNRRSDTTTRSKSRTETSERDDSDASSGSETSGETSHASSASDRSQRTRSSSSDGSESSNHRSDTTTRSESRTETSEGDAADQHSPRETARTLKKPKPRLDTDGHNRNGLTPEQLKNIDKHRQAATTLRADATKYANYSMAFSAASNSAGGLIAAPITFEAEKEQVESDKLQALAQRTEALVDTLNGSETAQVQVFQSALDMLRTFGDNNAKNMQMS